MGHEYAKGDHDDIATEKALWRLNQQGYLELRATAGPRITTAQGREAVKHAYELLYARARATNNPDAPKRHLPRD